MEVEKHLLITGSSNVSWKDAIVKSIAEASKSIDYLKSVKVLNQYGDISGNRITMYHVDLDISFVVDPTRS